MENSEELGKFEEWAIIELFGHKVIAGKVSEQQVGGCSFVRVDVPAVGKQKPFTRLFGNGAIYSINITDEETATAAADYYKPVPMEPWTVSDMLRKALPPGDGDQDETGPD